MNFLPSSGHTSFQAVTSDHTLSAATSEPVMTHFPICPLTFQAVHGIESFELGTQDGLFDKDTTMDPESTLIFNLEGFSVSAQPSNVSLAPAYDVGVAPQQQQQPHQIQDMSFPLLYQQVHANQSQPMMIQQQQLFQLQTLQVASSLPTYLSPQGVQCQQQQAQYASLEQIQYQLHASHQNQLLSSYPHMFTQPATISSSEYRTQRFGRLSSPEGSASVSSENGHFELTEGEPSCSTGVASESFVKPFDELEISEGIVRSMPMPAGVDRKDPPMQMSSGSCPPTLTLSSLATPAHALSFAPILSLSSAPVPYFDEGSISDDSDLADAHTECNHPGCSIACSSSPSLLRHTAGHKWRGKYSPVRCEACQTSLSNEFSAQRHITRADPSSRCFRMRIYSLMSSENEIEVTVRFYPTRPHGKKTIQVDLEKMRAKYFHS
ncbi:hypothetical protein BGZ54_007775 [Gamsiella multidivaricata]|nr:hypothetical protein BGZ54_007775 [Gamsiella multidivaricata]